MAMLLVLLWQAQNLSAQDRPPPEEEINDLQRASVSADVRNFLERRWDDTSFDEGLSLVENQSESTESRILVMDKLRSNRRGLTPRESRQLFDQAALVVRDSAEPPKLLTSAVRTMASVAVLMEERGQLTKEEMRSDALFLVDMVRDDTRDVELRGAAIRAVGDLQPDGARVLLQELLDDPIESTRPEIARNALIAIQSIEGANAVGSLSAILASTEDPVIFGTAAFSLGQINTTESMAKLVQYESRFPESNSVDAVLVDMEDIVLDVLSNPQDENLLFAVGATRHLWRDGQRERYVPLLRELLTTAPVTSRQAILDRLLDAAGTLEFEAEKYELELILPEVVNQPELAKYADQIRRRLSATVVVPGRRATSVPVVPETSD